MFNRLIRDRGPIDDSVFVVMPFGKQEFSNDQGELVVYDFDEHYQDVLVPVIKAAGLVPVRTDSLFEGGDTLVENVWARLQEGKITVADLTGANRNVMLEFGWAYVLNKKIIPLTQCGGDVPSDLPGLRYIPYSPGWKDMERMKTELAARLEVLRAEPAAELRLVPMATSDVRPVAARVSSVTKEHVVVEAEKGQYGVLGNADVDLTRIIPNMAARFKVGEVLDGAFETSDGITKYTLVAGQTNPWPAIATEYPQGQVFTGKVVNVIDNVGAFVRLRHGVNGLIPLNAMRGNPPEIGTEVSVGVSRMDAANRRIQLAPVGGDRAAAPRESRPGGPAVGERFDAEVVRTVPEEGRSGGYALVKLPGHDRPAMLHCTRMSEDVRADLNNGELKRGELLLVEVLSVGKEGGVRVRDLEDTVTEN